jgi:hypothetical protein
VSTGRFREAEVEVLRALSGLPADLRALNLLALVRFKLGRLEADYISVRGTRATIGKLVLGPSELRAIRNELSGASYMSAAREVGLKLSKPGAVKEVVDLVDAIVTARRAT